MILFLIRYFTVYGLPARGLSALWGAGWGRGAGWGLSYSLLHFLSLGQKSYDT